MFMFSYADYLFNFCYTYFSWYNAKPTWNSCSSGRMPCQPFCEHTVCQRAVGSFTFPTVSSVFSFTVGCGTSASNSPHAFVSPSLRRSFKLRIFTWQWIQGFKDHQHCRFETKSSTAFGVSWTAKCVNPIRHLHFTLFLWLFNHAMYIYLMYLIFLNNF